jgi:AraC-like DNA-binding protein
MTEAISPQEAMLFRAFPQHQVPGFNPDAPCPVIGWPTAVFHTATVPDDYPTHQAPLSLLCSFGGTTTYTVGQRQIAIDDTSYLVLNDGTPRTFTVEQFAPVEALQVYIRPERFAAIVHSLTTANHRLLEQPDHVCAAQFTFFEHRSPADTILAPLLADLRRSIRTPIFDPARLDEQLDTIVAGLLLAHHHLLCHIERLPATRAATRHEIYRRLAIARDFMHAHAAAPIRLHQIAAAAALSPHHFLRLFRQVFHETPHHYLTRIRLEHARRLLTTTDLPISAVCQEVGFSSVTSFSLLFKRHCHLTPSDYRLQQQTAQFSIYAP